MSPILVSGGAQRLTADVKFGEGHLASRRSARRIGDRQPVQITRHREVGHEVPTIEEGIDDVVGQWPFEMHGCDSEVLFESPAEEGYVELSSHHAVRAVAPDKPWRLCLLDTVVVVAQLGDDAVGMLCQRHALDASLDRDAEVVEALG